MIFFETTTTKRLEGYARARGLDWRIAYTPNNAGGRYHLIERDGSPLTRWRGLGWSRRDVEDHIQQESATDIN